MLCSCFVLLCLGVAVSTQGTTSYIYPSICAPKNSTILDPARSYIISVPLLPFKVITNISKFVKVPANTRIPDMPYPMTEFQLHIEATIIDKQTTWTAEEYYDEVNNRAALRILRNNSMDSMIFEFKQDQIVVYDVNKNCSVTQLTADPFGNEMIKGSGGGGIPHFYTTNSALRFAKSNGLMYKGTKVVRSINCNWWQSCMSFPNLLSNFTLDFYFAAKPGFSRPVMAEVQGLTATLSGLKQFHHQYKYFDYRNRIWDSDSVFDLNRVCNHHESGETVRFIYEPQTQMMVITRQATCYMFVLTPDEKAMVHTDTQLHKLELLARIDDPSAQFSTVPHFSLHPNLYTQCGKDMTNYQIIQ